DVLRTRRDCGEHDLRRRDGEVWAVMLTHADEVDAELVCQNRLVDDVPYDAWLRQQGPIVGEGHVAKGVEPDLELHHRSQPTEPAADSPRAFSALGHACIGSPATDSTRLQTPPGRR